MYFGEDLNSCIVCCEHEEFVLVIKIQTSISQPNLTRMSHTFDIRQPLGNLISNDVKYFEEKPFLKELARRKVEMFIRISQLYQLFSFHFHTGLIFFLINFE